MQVSLKVEVEEQLKLQFPVPARCARSALLTSSAPLNIILSILGLIRGNQENNAIVMSTRQLYTVRLTIRPANGVAAFTGIRQFYFRED